MVEEYKIGDHVEKISGSKWRGTVVGHYSTALTPNGVCVESDTETGSVQIYPAKALRRTPTPAGTGSGEDGKLAALVASLTDDEIHVVEDLRSLAEHAGRGSRIQNTCREAANMIEARALAAAHKEQS